MDNALSVLPGLESSLSDRDCASLLKESQGRVQENVRKLQTRITLEIANELSKMERRDCDDKEWWDILQNSLQQLQKYQIDYEGTAGPTRTAFFIVGTAGFEIRSISNLDKFRRNSTGIILEWIRMEPAMGLANFDQLHAFMTCIFSMWCSVDQLMVTGDNARYKRVMEAVMSKHEDGIVQAGNLW